MRVGRYKQKATYWKRSGVDERGDSKFSDPEIVDVRWESFSGRRYNNAEENEATQLNATNNIFFKDNLKVKIGDWFYLGETTASDPRDVKGAKEVQDVNEITNLYGNKATRKAEA